MSEAPERLVHTPRHHRRGNEYKRGYAAGYAAGRSTSKPYDVLALEREAQALRQEAKAANERHEYVAGRLREARETIERLRARGTP